jgi:hypothetical protein
MLCTESKSFEISKSLLTPRIYKSNYDVSDTSVHSSSAILNEMNSLILLLTW